MNAQVEMKKKLECINLVAVTQEKAAGGGKSDEIYFLQLKETGMNVFVHPLMTKALLSEYGDYSKFPRRVTGKVLEVEEIVLTADLKKRNPHLRHLATHTTVHFLEIELEVSGYLFFVWYWVADFTLMSFCPSYIYQN